MHPALKEFCPTEESPLHLYDLNNLIIIYFKQFGFNKKVVALQPGQIVVLRHVLQIHFIKGTKANPYGYTIVLNSVQLIRLETYLRSEDSVEIFPTPITKRPSFYVSSYGIVESAN